MGRKHVVAGVHGSESRPGSVPAPCGGESEDRLVQELIGRLSQGDRAAQEELFRRFHSELRIVALHLMQKQPVGHTLQPTALVDEAFVKLFGREPMACQDKAHLMRASARAMDQVLKDHARAPETFTVR